LCLLLTYQYKLFAANHHYANAGFVNYPIRYRSGPKYMKRNSGSGAKTSR
jgi:hypothetical protein